MLMLCLPVELVTDLFGCNVLLRHVATNNINSNMHTDPPHSPHCKKWYAFEV